MVMIVDMIIEAIKMTKISKLIKDITLLLSWLVSSMSKSLDILNFVRVGKDIFEIVFSSSVKF